MRHRRRSVLIAATAALALHAGPAAAQRAEITQLGFDSDGLPSLVANPAPDGARGEVSAWRTCPPAEACRPAPFDRKDPRFLEPGDVAAGTAFEVDVTADDSTVTTDRSAPWRGRVTALRGPTFSGRLRVGRLLVPQAGTWTGGWGGEYSLLRLEACRDRAGHGCETLSAQGKDAPQCSGGRAVLARRYAGWWVRAVDDRNAEGTTFAGVGYGAPAEIPVARPSRTVVRSPLRGPVGRARPGRFRSCR